MTVFSWQSLSVIFWSSVLRIWISSKVISVQAENINQKSKVKGKFGIQFKQIFFGIAVFSSFHRYPQLFDILRVFLILYSLALGLWMSWAGFGIFVSTPLSKQVALMATLKVILQPTQYLSFFCAIIHVGQTRMYNFPVTKLFQSNF